MTGIRFKLPPIEDGDREEMSFDPSTSQGASQGTTEGHVIWLS